MDRTFNFLKGRAYPCNWCACTGIVLKKWFQLKFWKINFEKNKVQICKFCHGKGFLEWSIEYRKSNEFRSWRSH